MKAIRHIVLLLVIVQMVLTSCSHEYSITGNVSHDVARGQMLYLSVNHDMQTRTHIDSCQIVHGRFNMIGEADTIVMARLYVDREMVMPLVIESGEMDVKIDYYTKSVKGGTLNVLLNKYLLEMAKLQSEWEELYERRIRLYMSGNLKPHIHDELDAQEQDIRNRMEMTETKFICENYTNALGPGMFLLLTERLPLPLITPQIEEILYNAPNEFLNTPIVMTFMKMANYKVGSQKK